MISFALDESFKCVHYKHNIDHSAFYPDFTIESNIYFKLHLCSKLVKEILMRWFLIEERPAKIDREVFYIAPLKQPKESFSRIPRFFVKRWNTRQLSRCKPISFYNPAVNQRTLIKFRFIAFSRALELHCVKNCIWVWVYIKHKKLLVALGHHPYYYVIDLRHVSRCMEWDNIDLYL